MFINLYIGQKSKIDPITQKSPKQAMSDWPYNQKSPKQAMSDWPCDPEIS